MGPTELLLLPFRVLRPPVLETPFTTIPLPPLKVTGPILFLSCLVITSGAVFCFVTNAPLFAHTWDRFGQPSMTWVARNDPSHQCILEGAVFAVTVVLGGLSGVAAFATVTAKRKWKRTLAYAYALRLAYTFPVWALLMFEVFTAKIPSYTLSFKPLV